MSDVPPGAQIGRYVIEREVARGGMGVVYRAVDPALQRPVALKLLARHLDADPNARARFQREAAAIAHLKHPHLALVYEFGEHHGQPFIALEWVEGRSLHAVLAEAGPLPPETVQRLLEQLASGLDYAHGRGVVHRDLKPANIMVTPEGQATLVDFGLAWRASEPALTATGLVFGTPRYIAPEQIRGDDLDGRADQYSLAVIVYEMLTGQLPFTGDSTPTLLHHHLYTPPLPITEHNPALPPAVEAALSRALAKQPAERFRTLTEFSQALSGRLALVPAPPQQLAAPVGPPRRLWAPLAWTTGVLGVLGLLALFAWGNFAQFNRAAQRTAEAAAALTQAAATAVAALPVSPTTAPTPTLPPPTTAPTEAPTEAPPTEAPAPDLTATPTLIPTPVANAPREGGWWPQIAGDGARTGFVAEGLGGLNPTPAWSRFRGGGITGAVVGGGRVFVGTDDGFLRALFWESGLQAWEAGLGARPEGSPVLYGDDEHFIVLQGAEAAALIGIDAWSGAELWRLGEEALPGVVRGGPVLGDDGRAYLVVETNDGPDVIQVIDPIGGGVLNTLLLPEDDYFYLPPAAAAGLVVAPGGQQSVHAYNLETGDRVWTGDVRGGPSAPATLAPDWGRLFVGTDQGYLHALWLDSGAQAWPPARASAAIVGLAHDNTRVYATAEDGTVYAWWIETGETAWAINTGATSLAAAPLTDGAVVVVVTQRLDESGGEVLYLNAETGAEDTARRIALFDGGWHPPAPAGGWLFVPGWATYGLGP